MEKSFCLSHEAKQALYGLAYTCYTQGKYEEAAGHFRLLTKADMHSYDYWMGLGASLQMAKKYQKAIHAYEMAACLNPTDPQLHIQAADCFFGSGHARDALFALACAERAAGMNKPSKKNQNLLKQLTLMQQAWEK